ncbi:hypothetical protein [Burkholderia vietnamiensis]|uniref:hypothetical protein n=1 Tax=Burkholderia vietnamiensis TaxID=60552 RepID=UPI001CF57583|nr:hypothetical protein [Burkholderia vietnamiensis]MCA8266442.1 hypothetical protein [Burkholderia vietnamiensis]
MQAITKNPAFEISEARAIEVLFSGFRKCDRNRNNRCVVMFGDEPIIVTAELSLNDGEFIVTAYDEAGRFVASARCDQHDR